MSSTRLIVSNIDTIQIAIKMFKSVKFNNLFVSNNIFLWEIVI